MAIILARHGQPAIRLERTTIDRESYLQQYIFDHPEALPLDEVDEDVRLLVLLREFPTSSGPIDALATDGDGRLYLIETKLYKNPDKRLVLAQILDYGAALWNGYASGDEFVDRIDALMNEGRGKSLRQAFSDTYGPAADADGILSALKAAFDAVEYRFVVLMDTLDDRLKALIEFVNANSNFSVYGVGLDFYQDAELDILIPTLFGAEVRKTTAQSSPRGHWDAERFLDDARQRLTAGEFTAVKTLHTFAVAHTDNATYGSGQQTGSINFKSDAVSNKSLFTLWTDGKLKLNFKWLNRSDSELNWRVKFGTALEAAGIALPPNYADMFPVLEPATWMPRLDTFISVVKRVLSDVGGSVG